MLYQNTDKPLYRAEYDAVNHYRSVLLAVFADVFRFESLRKLEVELNSSALPRSADRIGKVKIDLRTVKRAVALVDYVFEMQFVQSLFKRVGRLFPVFVAAHAVFRSG